MNSSLLDLVRELNTLNDDNLADRVIANNDVQWCLSELQDILEAERPTLTPPNEPLTPEQLREMKDEPAYLKVFDPSLQSGWHIIKEVTEDKIIFRGWGKVYVPIDSLGLDYNLYRRPPEGEED